jgi:hypothetical protein
MINFFTLGLNQMITWAEQMQRLETEMFRIFLRSVSNSTERLGSFSQFGGSRMVELAEETTQEATQGLEQMHAAVRPSVSSRAKSSPSRSRAKTQPKRRRR